MVIAIVHSEWRNISSNQFNWDWCFMFPFASQTNNLKKKHRMTIYTLSSPSMASDNILKPFVSVSSGGKRQNNWTSSAVIFFTSVSFSNIVAIISLLLFTAEHAIFMVSIKVNLFGSCTPDSSNSVKISPLALIGLYVRLPSLMDGQ